MKVFLDISAEDKSSKTIYKVNGGDNNSKLYTMVQNNSAYTVKYKLLLIVINLPRPNPSKSNKLLASSSKLVDQLVQKRGATSLQVTVPICRHDLLQIARK